MLLWPALFGLLSTGLQLAKQCSPNANPLTGPFAIFVSLWAAAFSTHWRGIEAILAFRWGTEGFNREASERRTFVGKRAEINTLESKEKRLTLAVRHEYSSYVERVKSVTLSVCLISALVIAALVCCTFALWMKAKSNSICDDMLLESNVAGPSSTELANFASEIGRAHV